MITFIILKYRILLNLLFVDNKTGSHYKITHNVVVA